MYIITGLMGFSPFDKRGLGASIIQYIYFILFLTTRFFLLENVKACER